jgi:hypothetical protein
MTNGMNFAIVCALLGASAALIRCSDGNRLAGAGSETRNGIVIVGKLHSDDGSPARNSVVKLIRDDYDPVADNGLQGSFIDTTDSAGAFRFRRVDSGSYNVLARNDGAGMGALVRGIQVKKDDSLVTAPSGNLRKTGSMAVDLSGVVDTFAEYIYLPGTDIFALVNGNRPVMLGGIPAGIFPVVSYATKTGDVCGMRYKVTVKPEDTVLIRNPAWKYSSVVCFNTSSSGAGVDKDVRDFPVLIRLTGNNFNFNEAQSQGNDIRFAGSDNSFIPFEIERWNPVTELAEVWVNIDTVRGNNSGQTIVMYWGNPDATVASDGAAVFDTVRGFQAVWHFNQLSADSVRDATANRFNGVTVGGMTAVSVAEGAVGEGRTFNGKTGYITIPNSASGRLSFPQNGNYTLSAWVNIDTLDSASHVVMSKGLFQYYLWFTYIYQNTPNWEFVKFEDKTGWKCPVFPIAGKQWALVSGVSNGTSHRLYVNGEPSDTGTILYSATESLSASDDFVIGCYLLADAQGQKSGYSYFDGTIDEVRVCSRSRSAEWIRLCYMNQRTDDKLITFK